MIEKDVIQGCINSLLESARNRGTNQGVLVYTNALDRVRDAKTQNELIETTRNLNKAIAAIEAHGYFTKEEFTTVITLRNLI